MDPLNIRYRQNLPGAIPSTRLYVHGAGIETFGTGSQAYMNAIEYFREVSGSKDVRKFLEEQKIDFLIALAWGDWGEKTMDLLGFTEIKSGNANIKPRVFQNGKILPLELTTFCEDGFIITAKEAEHRRSCPSFAHFIRNPPGLEGLLPKEVR